MASKRFGDEIKTKRTHIGMPLYWQHEVTGRMREIVRKFFENEPLDARELEVLRGYVHQWVVAMPHKPEDYNRILEMSQDELKRYIWEVLVTEYAIDPF